MEKKYKYIRDKRSRWTTFVVFLIIAAAITCFYLWLPNQYIPTWFTITLICIILIVILSIPRYIKVTDDELEIHCIVDLTRIHIEDIESVRILDKSRARMIIPLIASCGFFGYFGYFFNLREWTLYKVYTTAKVNRIEIEDIYEGHYIVNCNEPDEFVKRVLTARNKKREEIFERISSTGNQ